MCHMSPTAQILGLLITIITTLFTGWHIWCFDRGRCLLFTKRDVFRWSILMMLVCALICFTIWSGMLSWVKYHEYYGVIPHPDGNTSIGPIPFQLWSEDRQTLIRAGYHIASVGWGLLVSVHAEETLYWAYLIGSIRRRDSQTWFQSRQFKIWVLCVITAMVIEPVVACIETKDLNKMEHYIFFSGAILALILFLGGMWLVMVFPNFIKQSRRQGANPEVLARLQYFKELNGVRTVFRFFYALCLLTLSIDAWTDHRYVNTSPFWTDVLFTMAYFCALTSTAIAVMILLPRSMAEEAGAPKNAVFVQAPPTYRKPSHPYSHHTRTASASQSEIDSAGPHTPPDIMYTIKSTPTTYNAYARDSAHGSSPWSALGERLNIDKEHLGEMDHGTGSQQSFELPFAAQPGSRHLREGEVVPHVPRTLNEFRSPVDVNQVRRPVDLNIVVTSETVVQKD